MDFFHDQLFGGRRIRCLTIGCSVDDRPAFISGRLDLQVFVRVVTLDFSQPRKLTDTSCIEPFNGKFRLECLSENSFVSLDEARRKCEARRRDHDHDVRIAQSTIKRPMKLAFLSNSGPTLEQVRLSPMSGGLPNHAKAAVFDAGASVRPRERGDFAAIARHDVAIRGSAMPPRRPI